MTLTVEYYKISETSRLTDDYPKMCDECVFIPVWKIERPLPGAFSRVGYACSEHVDTVLMLVEHALPGGHDKPPAE